MSASWTIRELCQQVEESLAGEDAPANGQVRAVPDERSVRYYTTLGLIDRPLLRGRTALYGARHLAQLVAIKRYQSEGKTLAEIQQSLPAMDDHSLARFTGIALATKPPRPGSRRDFWREPEMELAPPETETKTETETETETPTPPTIPTPPAFSQCLELTLAPGVRLALTTARPATDADAAALLSAATPLLQELLRRHLIPSTLQEPTP
ncbi:MAG TPA: MerR family transcriptional regulator [Kofleriaceae bacterium]|nr:MerR family transcriptional regulator [Kofleriaceae bacterium]